MAARVRLAAAALLAAAIVAVPCTGLVAPAEARSGGYSRPALRTPAPTAPRAAPRTPSFGGSDLGLSGRSSAQALEAWRDRQRTPQRTPSIGRSPRTGQSSIPRTESPRGWTPPPYAMAGPSRFGLFDAAMLWFLLDTLSRPGRAGFFHDHQDDPALRQWRAEADRQAEGDSELRAKLDRLDRALAERSDSPRDPSSPPPARPPAPPSAFPWGTLLVLGVVLGALWKARRGLLPGRAPANRPAAARQGPFRLGMTLTADPTPFVLAAGATKVQPPPDDGSGLLSVAAVGVAEAGTTALHRLYLPDGRSFFQLHLDDDGRPDECRLFQRIDQVFPATPEDWAFWLDPVEGMIGWPSFETKDGTAYDRRWSPGAQKVPPVDLTETIADLGGSRAAREQAMLYARATGLPEPGPAAEYLLVAAVEAGGQAWVEVRAGIDLPPAALSL